MKNLKSLLLAAVVLSGAALVAVAATPKSRVVPRDQNGNPAQPGYGGFLHVRNSATDEMVICSGKCLLAAALMNTGATTAILTIRNSSVADGAGAIVLRSRYSNTGPGFQPVGLPILLDKGITATVSNISSAEEVTILYEDMD